VCVCVCVCVCACVRACARACVCAYMCVGAEEWVRYRLLRSRRNSGPIGPSVRYVRLNTSHPVSPGDASKNLTSSRVRTSGSSYLINERKHRGKQNKGGCGVNVMVDVAAAVVAV
jgi:hypothetical protein